MIRPQDPSLVFKDRFELSEGTIKITKSECAVGEQILIVERFGMIRAEDLEPTLIRGIEHLWRLIWMKRDQA